MERGIYYKFKVKCKSGTEKNEGFLNSINDTSLVLIKRIGNGDKLIFDTISYNEIDRLKIWKRNRMSTGFIIGTSAGLIATTYVVITEDTDEDKVLTQIAEVFVGSIASPLVGVVGLGIAKLTCRIWIINRNKNCFNKMREKFIGRELIE